MDIKFHNGACLCLIRRGVGGVGGVFVNINRVVARRFEMCDFPRCVIMGSVFEGFVYVLFVRGHPARLFVDFALGTRRGSRSDNT